MSLENSSERVAIYVLDIADSLITETRKVKISGVIPRNNEPKKQQNFLKLYL